MKPEDVTDEMEVAFRQNVITTNRGSLIGLKAAIAAAINAMPQTDAQAQIDALKAELQQRALEVMSLDAQNMELAAERDALRIEIRVAEDALQKALSALAVSFEDCCADTGTIIPAKVEHLVSEAKMRIQRRPDPAKGAPRPAGHNPVA